MGRNVDGARNGRGCVPDRVYLGVSDWEDGVMQKTAKTVEDVLSWIETTPHHFASICDEPGFFILKGYGDKLRIPENIQQASMRLVEPSKDRFDNRMYRATKSGRARLRKHMDRLS